MPASPKRTKSAKVNVAKLQRVRRYLGAQSDSDAISRAIDLVEEQRLFQALIDSHGGSLEESDFEPTP